LCTAIGEIERGLIDAHLGGGLLKKRIAVARRGKRGGQRAILVYRRSFRAVFVTPFAKNAGDNVSREELRALKLLASQYLLLAAADIAKLARDGNLIEVICDEQDFARRA